MDKVARATQVPRRALPGCGPEVPPGARAGLNPAPRWRQPITNLAPNSEARPLAGLGSGLESDARRPAWIGDWRAGVGPDLLLKFVSMDGCNAQIPVVGRGRRERDKSDRLLPYEVDPINEREAPGRPSLNDLDQSFCSFITRLCYRSATESDRLGPMASNVFEYIYLYCAFIPPGSI